MHTQANKCLLLLVWTAAPPLPSIHLLSYGNRFLRRSHTMPCLAAYRCIVHSPTKNFMRHVLWKELHMNFLHCCMLCPPTRHLYWTVVLAHRFSLSESLMDDGGIRQRQHQPYHSVHQYAVLWTRQTASCANVLLLPFILLYQTYPINDTGWWSWDNVCKRYIFIKLPGKCGLVCFS